MTHKELHSALLYVILLCHRCSSLHPALCWLHHGPVSLEFAHRSPPQSGSSPALPSPLVSCWEAPWTAAIRPWSSNTRRARSNGRILQLGRLNISRPSTAHLSNRFALLDCRWKRLLFFTRLCAQRLLSSLVRWPWSVPPRHSVGSGCFCRSNGWIWASVHLTFSPSDFLLSPTALKILLASKRTFIGVLARRSWRSFTGISIHRWLIIQPTSEDRSRHLHIRAESSSFATLFLSEIEETDNVYNSFDVIRTVLCTVPYPMVGFTLSPWHWGWLCISTASFRANYGTVEHGRQRISSDFQSRKQRFSVLFLRVAL